MKLNIETREDHQAKIVAEFDPTELNSYKGKAARRIAGRAKIPGFRPGKAPYDVVARLYGEPAIEEEAIELMVDAVYPEILKEANIEPAAMGALEDISKSDPLSFTFVVPLEPTVDLGNYREIRKKYAPKEVTAAQVDEFIQRLRRSYATAEPVERPAENGDMVYAMVNAVLLKPTGDEKPELLTDSPIQLVIGENDTEASAYPYPGFGANLISMAANDTKKVKYTYPKDSPYEKLRGKAVEFTVLMQSIKKLALPEMDDEFARTLGEFETFDQLKEAVKTQLNDRQTGEYDEKYYDDLLDEVVKGATVKFPPQLLDHEVEHLVENITHDLSHQNMELDVYLKTINKDKDAWLAEEVRPAASRNLSRGLVLREISEVEKVLPANEDIQAEAGNILNQISQATNPKTLEKQLKNKDYLNGITLEAFSRAKNKMVYERLRDIATGKADQPAADESEVKKAKRPAKKSEKVEKTESEQEVAPAKKTKKAAASVKQEE